MAVVLGRKKAAEVPPLPKKARVAARRIAITVPRYHIPHITQHELHTTYTT